MKRFRIYTGPTIVVQVADALIRQGFTALAGTEAVYVDAVNATAVESALVAEFGTATGFRVFEL